MTIFTPIISCQHTYEEALQEQRLQKGSGAQTLPSSDPTTQGQNLGLHPKEPV